MTDSNQPPAKRERVTPTDRELAQAGNALIEWFNAEGLTSAEALKVMSKVVAKIVHKGAPPLTLPGGVRAYYHEEIDAFSFTLVNDLNARIYAKRNPR